MAILNNYNKEKAPHFTELMTFKKLMAVVFMAAIGTACSDEAKNLYKVEVERECIGCDLEGVDLAGQNLGAKYRLSNSSAPLSVGPKNLNQAVAVNLSQANLAFADLSDSKLVEVQLNEANLTQANLSQANLKGAQLENANLSGANLKDVNLQEANLRGANLRGADLRNANLSKADLTGVLINKNTLWQGADLSEIVGSREKRNR